MQSARFTSLLCLTLTLLTFACSQSGELIENNDPNRYTLAADVLWASPDEFDLTMDIYTPNSGTGPFPVLIMFHGGGWLINNKSIMDQAAAYLATNSRYVICNVNYRLLSDRDNTVTLNQIVEDAFGAVLWVKQNIGAYNGDGARVAVTGDSAGGHLSAMVVNLGTRLSASGFAGEVPGFKPSYLPPDQTAEQVAQHDGLAVQAAILSYAAFDVYQAALAGFEEMTNPFWLMGGAKARGAFGDAYNVSSHPELYRLVSPLHNIPDVSTRKLPPQLLTAGGEDTLVTPASVKAYVEKLRAAGQSVEYWEHTGRPHAYLDSGSNLLLGISFEADAPPALDVMISFLDGVFYQ